MTAGLPAPAPLPAGGVAGRWLCETEAATGTVTTDRTECVVTGWATAAPGETSELVVQRVSLDGVQPDLLSLWAWAVGLLVLLAAVAAVAVIRR